MQNYGRCLQPLCRLQAGWYLDESSMRIIGESEFPANRNSYPPNLDTRKTGDEFMRSKLPERKYFRLITGCSEYAEARVEYCKWIAYDKFIL